MRSERSLIQTIGRAARNLNGRAILYADSITGSMKRALDETERRRQKQLQFNLDNDITAKGVEKSVTDIMEAAYPGAPMSAKNYARVAEEVAEYGELGSDKLSAKIKELEKKMFKHAQELEFEQAAKIRDQIKKLEDRAMGMPELRIINNK